MPKTALATKMKRMDKPLCKKTVPNVIIPTVIGIKKKTRCFKRNDDARSIHSNLITPVNNKVNNNIIPSTFPGIGKYNHETMIDPILFNNHSTNNCEIKIAIDLICKSSNPFFFHV